jgi:RND family efflux transporter MFP subunit
MLHVRVIRPSPSRFDARLTLPGTLQGTQEAQINSRASGYVKALFKDIGAKVKKGEVMATLDIPEVRRQVDEADANFQLAKTSYERWTRLRAKDVVSQQELDEKTSTYRQTLAIQKRMREQLGFGQVVAPFDGVVTRRNVNVGDLVNAGNSGQALFSIAQTNTLHVYFYVPQDRATLVRVGDSVDIIQTALPDKSIKAHIARTAGAIDLNSRTLQIDVEISNGDLALLPGAYVEVVLYFKPSDNLVLPTNTLLFGTSGAQVAVVKEGKVERRSVILGTDYGQMVEVKSGVSVDDHVIENPPDAIVPGQPVVEETSPSKAHPGI